MLAGPEHRLDNEAAYLKNSSHFTPFEAVPSSGRPFEDFEPFSYLLTVFHLFE